MRRQPLVSIITPCYNGETFLDRYFQSVLNQTYTNLELIFINDGSTDKTEEIALEYKEKLERKGIKFIYAFQKNQGQAAALNRGLKLFTGDYLTWPDSDDEMFPTCIQKKVEFLENNTEYGLCACKIMSVDEKYPDIVINMMELQTKTKEEMFLSLLRIKTVFTPIAYLVRTSAFLKVIPDREIFSGKGGQNVQILLPLAHEFECGLLNEILGKYYIRQDSHSHGQVEHEQVIQQLKNYETIVMETLKKIGPDVFEMYDLIYRRFYGHMRYGIAIDSGDIKLIKREFCNLKALKSVRMKDRLLYIKNCFGRL